MKILLAIDGSGISLRAVKSLIELVRSFRDKPELHLLHVHPPVAVGLATQPISHESLERYYREEGEASLADSRQLLETAELPFASHIQIGQPAETIVRVAQELRCDVICLGSHGHSVLKSDILGSVAANVLRLAEAPVLVVN